MSDKLYEDLAIEFLAYRIATREKLEPDDFHTPFNAFAKNNVNLIWSEKRTGSVLEIFYNKVIPNFKRKLQLNKPQGAKFTKYLNKHLQK